MESGVTIRDNPTTLGVERPRSSLLWTQTRKLVLTCPDFWKDTFVINPRTEWEWGRPGEYQRHRLVKGYHPRPDESCLGVFLTHGVEVTGRSGDDGSCVGVFPTRGIDVAGRCGDDGSYVGVFPTRGVEVTGRSVRTEVTKDVPRGPRGQTSLLGLPVGGSRTGRPRGPRTWVPASVACHSGPTLSFLPTPQSSLTTFTQVLKV